MGGSLKVTPGPTWGYRLEGRDRCVPRGKRDTFPPPTPPSRLQRNHMEALLLAVPSDCNQDHFHASPHKGIQAFIQNYDLLQTGPGVFQWSQEMLMGFEMLYPVEWFSICMQRDTLKGLMTFGRLVPISISHHHPSVADLPKPRLKPD